MIEIQQTENWFSINDITKYLDVSYETVLQWISNRNMPASKVR